MEARKITYVEMSKGTFPDGVYETCKHCIHAYLPFECDNMDITFGDFLKARVYNDLLHEEDDCKGFRYGKAKVIKDR